MRRALLVLVALLLVAAPAAAQNAPPPTVITADDVNAVARRMYCPECENLPLIECGTLACQRWRAEIRAQLEAGRTPDQVIAGFVATYGEHVVGFPQDPWLRLLSMAGPVLAALGALALGGWWVRRMARSATPRTTASASATAAPDDDYAQQLERDLGPTL